jgi:ABC-type nitrate/sulfonate/bicarbonate transport system permease component
MEGYRGTVPLAAGLNLGYLIIPVGRKSRARGTFGAIAVLATMGILLFLAVAAITQRLTA